MENERNDRLWLWQHFETQLNLMRNFYPFGVLGNEPLSEIKTDWRLEKPLWAMYRKSFVFMDYKGRLSCLLVFDGHEEETKSGLTYKECVTILTAFDNGKD